MIVTHSSCHPLNQERGSYRPREPEASILYQVMAANLETFLASQERRGRNVPDFVEREMRAFMECGIPACGFIRL